MARATSRKQQRLIEGNQGLTLTELMAAVAIVGILASTALPNYFRQIQRTHQNEAASTLAQLQTSIAAFSDEFGTPPTTWQDLSEIAAVMTKDGPAGASEGELSSPITLISDKYTVQRSKDETGKIFTLIAEPIELTNTERSKPFNAMACVDLNTGASDLRLGNQRGIDGPAKQSDLRC